VIPSPEEWVDNWVNRHPMGIPMAAALQKAGRLEDTRAAAEQALRDGGEEVDGGIALPTSALVTRLTV